MVSLILLTLVGYYLLLPGKLFNDPASTFILGLKKKAIAARWIVWYIFPGLFFLRLKRGIAKFLNH